VISLLNLTNIISDKLLEVLIPIVKENVETQGYEFIELIYQDVYSGDYEFNLSLRINEKEYSADFLITPNGELDEIDSTFMDVDDNEIDITLKF
jgi:hypothetical protein